MYWETGRKLQKLTIDEKIRSNLHISKQIHWSHQIHWGHAEYTRTMDRNVPRGVELHQRISQLIYVQPSYLIITNFINHGKHLVYEKYLWSSALFEKRIRAGFSRWYCQAYLHRLSGKACLSTVTPTSRLSKPVQVWWLSRTLSLALSFRKSCAVWGEHLAVCISFIRGSDERSWVWFRHRFIWKELIVTFTLCFSRLGVAVVVLRLPYRFVISILICFRTHRNMEGSCL